MCATCPKAWPSWYEAWILYFVSNTVLHLNTCQVRSKLLLCTGHWKGGITVKKKIIKAITSEGLIHTSWHMSHYLTSHFSCSHAHFRRSPVEDPLKKKKKKKEDCSNPYQDPGPIKMQFWHPIHIPLVLWCWWQACHYFPYQIQASVQCKRQMCSPMHPDHTGNMFWLK